MIKTREITMFTQGKGSFHLVPCCNNLWESQTVRKEICEWHVNKTLKHEHLCLSHIRLFISTGSRLMLCSPPVTTF